MKKQYEISTFYCTKCAGKIELPRKMSQKREKGHLKKIYCINCKEEINHLEIRSNDMDFDLEQFKLDIEEGFYNESCKKICGRNR